MELLPDGLRVRLRSRARGTYLHGADDRVGVTLRQQRASPDAVWEVRRVQHDGRHHHLLLRNAASGYYLALAPSRVPPGHGRHRAIQQDRAEAGLRDTSWRAIRAGDGGGHIMLRHAYSSSNLRAAGWERVWHDGVTVEPKKGATSHWMIEAALPLSPAPPACLPRGVPKLVRVRVPRLALESMTGATLPVLAAGHTFIGYVAAGSVLGLPEVVEGSGEDLWAQELVMKAQLGCGQLPHGLTALAFLGRGDGIKMMPLRVLGHDAQGGVEALGNDNGVNGSPEAGVNHEEVAPGNRDGVQLHDHDADERAAEDHGAVADQGGDEPEGDRANAVVVGAQGAAEDHGAVADQQGGDEPEGDRANAVVVGAEGGAGADEEGLPLPAHAAAAGNPEATDLLNFYNGMLKKNQVVRGLVRQLNEMEEEARATGRRPDREQSAALMKEINKAVRGYRYAKKQAANLLRAMEGEVVAPCPQPGWSRTLRNGSRPPCAAGCPAAAKGA